MYLYIPCLILGTYIATSDVVIYNNRGRVKGLCLRSEIRILPKTRHGFTSPKPDNSSYEYTSVFMSVIIHELVLPIVYNSENIFPVCQVIPKLINT